MEGSGRAEDDTDKNRSRAGGAGYTDADKWGQHVTTDQKSMSVRTLKIGKDKDKDKNLFIRTKVRPELPMRSLPIQLQLTILKPHLIHPSVPR